MQHRMRGLTAALGVTLVALVLIVAVVVVSRGYGAEFQSRLGERGSQAPVVDLHDVAQLQAAFNRDAGTPRLVVLFSPT